MALSTVNVLGVLFLLCAISRCSFASGKNTTNTNATESPPTAMPKPYNTTILPTIYVTVDLDMTWTDFCMLRDVFKNQIASMIFEKFLVISPKKVIIHNSPDHCSKSAKNKYKSANLIVYITKQDDGHQEDVDKELTQQMYKKLDYITKSNNQWELGSVFNGKVKNVGAGGKDLTPLPDKVSEYAHIWIAIAIATAILIAIIIILVIIHMVKKPKQPENETVTYQPRDQEHGAVINPSAQPAREQPSQLSENYASSTKL